MRMPKHSSRDMLCESSPGALMLLPRALERIRYVLPPWNSRGLIEHILHLCVAATVRSPEFVLFSKVSFEPGLLTHRRRGFPPKNMRGNIEPATRQRWLTGLRQYAPWMFKEAAMVRNSQQESTLLPAEIVASFCSWCDSRSRTRRRLLANQCSRTRARAERLYTKPWIR